MLSTLSRIARTRAAPGTRSFTIQATQTIRPEGVDGPVAGLSYNGTTYPYRWLRDSCQCSECIHPTNRQKLHRTTDIPNDASPIHNGVQFVANGVQIIWDSGHKSLFPDKFLKRHSDPLELHGFHRDIVPQNWDAEHISTVPNLFIPYGSLQSPSGVLNAITQLTRYGLAFITGVPTEPTSDDSCGVRALAEKFGEIRPTFYGTLWDVKALHDSNNIAYTDLDLGLHMDLMYFQYPPRYQFLHCIRNRVIGGTSIFVDAINAAQTIREKYPHDFDLLTTIPVPFHYITDGHHMHERHLTIELDPIPSSDVNAPRHIRHVNYGPPFQAPFPSSTPPEFYQALSRYTALINEPSAKYEYTLKEGDAVIFDNRRVLHARTAFRNLADGGPAEGTVNRWLKGCYVEADSVLDRGRVLREMSAEW